MLARPGAKQAVIADLRESFRQGTAVLAADLLRYSRPWGFGLDEVTTTVYLPPVSVPETDLPVLWPGRRRGGAADPVTYEYDRAARDALAFAALFDRFIQNLRRYLGYEVQYFATIEPQRRLAPHVHIAMRGTVSRPEIRRVLAATYHQVWWPDTPALMAPHVPRPPVAHIRAIRGVPRDLCRCPARRQGSIV